MLKNNTHRGLLLIYFCLLCFFAVAYLFLAPVTTAPDEIAHFAYPRYVLENNKLPSFTSPQDTWESHQPPLYYLTSIPLVHIAQNVSIELQLHLNRLISLFWFLAAAMLLFLSVRTIFPHEPSFQILAMVPLGLPMVLYAAGTFSNDIAVLTGSAALLWCIVHKDKISSHTRAMIFGVLLGCILLIKFHVYPVILFATLVVLWKKPITYWVLVAVTALLVSSFWFIHNLQSVGDITGLRNTFILWESQQTTSWTLQTVFVFFVKVGTSFIGVFGKQNILLPTSAYVLVGIPLAFFFIISVIRHWKHALVKISASVLLSTFALLVYQSFSFFQPQGRYLISVIPFLGIPLAFFFQKKYLFRRTLIAVTSIILICGTNLLSLSVLRVHYKDNPVTSLSHTRTIEIPIQSFVDPGKSTKEEGGSLTIQSDGSIYTLLDLRFPTESSAFLTVESIDAQNTPIRVYWKVLGMHAFTEKRSFTATLKEDSQYIIPEEEISLIQDIQISFLDIQAPVTITRVTMTHLP